MSQEPTRRNAEREQFWRQTVADWEKSGESVAVFCARRGLQATSFYAWRRTLRGRDGQQAPRRPTWVPLRVVPDAILEVALPSGLIVRVPAGVEPSTAATLIAALRAAAC
jgi:transposase